MKIVTHLTGQRPILQHNGRLANPLDPYTRQLKALTAKKKKTDEDLVSIMMVEARGAAYETTDGLLGVPTQNMWRAVYDAATAYRRGADIKRALNFEDTVEPLFVDGKSQTVEAHLNEPDHVDYRPVSVNRNKTMRARLLVPLPWSVSFTFDLLDDVIDARDLAPILERAGRLVGLCDWRPTYGTFAVEVEA